jgi:DNA polymerase-3 subunit gamma/tau
LTDEKKKSLNEEDRLPLKSIAVEAHPNQSDSSANPAAPTATTPKAVETRPMAKPQSQVAPKQEFSRSTRPVSISISPLRNKQQDTVQETNNHAAFEVTNQQEPYSNAAFEKVWKGYIQLIPKVVSVVSYINNNKPAKIAEHTYELTFTNIFQEADFKKELNNICNHLRRELKNSNIQFVTKVVEIAEKDKRNDPEDIFKKMSEQNPALNILKKNLNLEID